MTKKTQMRISWLSLLFLALMTGVLSVYANYQLRKNLRQFSEDFLSHLEQTYHFKVTYERMRVNSFYYWQIEQLQLERENEKLSIKNLRIYLAWWKLFFRSRTLDLVRSVQINDIDIYISKKQPSPQMQAQKVQQRIFEDNPPLTEKTKEFLFYLFDLLQLASGQSHDFFSTKVDIKRLNVQIDALWGKLRVQDIYASVLPSAKEVNIDVQADVTPGVGALQESFQASLKGSISRETHNGEMIFSLMPPSKLFLIKQNMKFLARWQNNVLQIEKVVDSIPLDISLKIDAAKRYAYFGFNARSLDISKFLDLNIEANERVESTHISSHWNGGASFIYYPDLDMSYYEATGIFKTHFFGKNIALDIDFSGNNIQAQVKKFQLDALGFSLSYQGDWDMQNFFPKGELSLQAGGQKNLFILAMKSGYKGNHAQISSSRFEYNGVSLGDFDIGVNLNQGRYMTQMVYCTPDGQEMTVGGHFSRDSGIGQWHILAQDFPLLEWVRSKILPSFLAKWLINWDILLTLRPEGFFVDGRRFDFSQTPKRMLSSSFIMDNGQINISNLMIVWGSFFTRLNLSTQLNSSQFNGLLNVSNTDYEIYGRYTPNSVQILGDAGELSVQFDKKSLYLNLQDLLLGRHAQKDVKVSVMGSASWKNGFTALFNRLHMHGNTSNLEMRNIQIGIDGGKIESIIFQDNISRLSGQMGYRLYENEEDMQVDGVMELSGENGENVLLQVYYDEFWQGQLSLYRIPVERLKIEGLEGRLSTNLSFQMFESRPEIDGYMLFDGFYKNLRLAIDSGLNVNENGFQIMGNRIQYGKWQFLGTVVLGDFLSRGLEVSSQIRNISETIQTGLTMSIRPTSDSNKGSFAEIFSDDFSMLVQTQDIVVNERVFLPSYQLALERTDKEIRAISKGDLDLDFAYTFAGRHFSLYLDDDITSLFVQAKGSLSADNFFIDISKFSGLLGFLNPLLIMPRSGQRILGFTKGRFDGNVFIDSNHLINGSIDMNGGIRSAFSPNHHFKLNHKIAIHNSVMRMQDWTFRLAQGTQMVLNTTVNLAKENFSYLAHVDIHGGRGANFDFDILNYVKFRGKVLGWARYEGDARMGYLSGRLEFPTAEGSLASLTKYISTRENRFKNVVYKVPPAGYTILSGRDISYKDSTQEDDLSPFRFVSVDAQDMQNFNAHKDDNPEDRFRLIAGRDFTFYVPSRSLPTIQATLNPGEYVDLYMDITPGGDITAYLEGVLAINRGEINYFGNKFLIEKGGTILFDKNTEFNPYLDLKADYRVDSITNRVVTMHFANHAFDTYNPTFTVIPSLSQEQIMAILGASISTNSADFYSMSAGAIDSNFPQSVYDEADRERNSNLNNSSLGAFEQIIRTGTDTLGSTVSRMVENAVRFIPFIDTVTVKTNFISNFALDKLANSTSNTASNQDDLNQQILARGGDNFTRYLDGTSVYFGTYIDRNLFFQTKIDLEKSNALSRYADASQLKVNFYLDFQINTPLFLVDWAFNPMQNSRDGLSENYWKFRPEVTLTFSKTIAFRDWKDLREQFSNFGRKDSSDE